MFERAGPARFDQTEFQSETVAAREFLFPVEDARVRRGQAPELVRGKRGWAG
jgi:hypothetical protein